MTALAFTQATFATVIRVPNDYPSIQMAINAAVDGDEVVVSPGTWTNTPPISIAQNIILRSVDPTNQSVVAATILTSDGNVGPGIMLYTTNCVISGLTITGFTQSGTDNGGAIDGNGSTATIQYCRIVGNSVERTAGTAASGGGVAFLNGVIRNNLISSNLAYEGGGGAGLYLCTGVITI